MVINLSTQQISASRVFTSQHASFASPPSVKYLNELTSECDCSLSCEPDEGYSSIPRHKFFQKNKMPGRILGN